jgi:hypothetical protein
MVLMPHLFYFLGLGERDGKGDAHYKGKAGKDEPARLPIAH